MQVKVARSVHPESMSRGSGALGALCAATLLFAGSASAASFTFDATDVGTTFPVMFDGNVEQMDQPGLTGEADLLLTSFGQTTTFDILLRNTSSSPITGSGITSLGFNTSATLSSASSTGDFDIAVIGGSYPNQFGNVDVCFKTGQQDNNCSGNQGGPDPLQQIAFTGTLNFASAPSTLTVDNFGVRYQRIEGSPHGTSGTGSGNGNGNGNGGPGPPVPEPSAALVFSVGLLVAGSRMRRRARR